MSGKNRQGGGTGLLLSLRWCFTPLPMSYLTICSLEFHAVSVMSPMNLFITVIYHALGTLGDFLEEMETLLRVFSIDSNFHTVLDNFNLSFNKLQYSCLLPFWIPSPWHLTAALPCTMEKLPWAWSSSNYTPDCYSTAHLWSLPGIFHHLSISPYPD